MGTRHQPHSARPCELALRAVEAARGRPGRAPPAWVWGVRGRALSHPRLPALWAGGRGPLPTGCGCGGVRAWGPVTNPTARALACCGGGMRMPRGGASCLVVGRPGSGALPTPTARPLGGLPGPTTHWLWVWKGAGVGTRHQPHSARSCELALRAVGAARGRLGGAPPARVWGVRGRALSHPRLPALWTGCRGPLPTGCGCGGMRVWGPVTNPTARALACCGEGMRVPGGGASCLGVGRPGSGALPPLTARLLGGLPGPTTHWLWVRGGCGHGDPSPTPQRALLRAGFARCGGGMRVPGGGASCLGVWRPGSGALPTPTARPLGGLPGPTTHWLLVRGAAGVGTSHQPHSARSCALWGRHEADRGGRLLPGCAASGVGRSPIPKCPPSGQAAGAHYRLAVGAGGRGRGDPSPTPQRALLQAGFGRCGGGMRLPGLGASCLGVGRPGSGALPPPAARPLGGLAGPTTHWLLVRGGAGVGTRHQPHSARSCMLWGRHEGARGGRLLPGCGASGVGRSPTPNCPPSGRAAGAHYPLAVGAGGRGPGDPSPTPQRALLRAGFARCGGGTRAPRGGASCLGVGRPGSGALPAPTACPLGGLPGPTTHWLWVRGGAGVGARHQPHSARSCEQALRAMGAARGRPGGALPAWVCGVRGRVLFHPRLPALWAGCRGPIPTGCGCGGVRAWGPVTNPTARALASWLCAPWGLHEGARGGRFLPGCAASGVGCSSTLDCPPSGRAAGAHYPLALGAGGCRRGDPSPTPQRALLHAVGEA